MPTASGVASPKFREGGRGKTSMVGPRLILFFLPKFDEGQKQGHHVRRCPIFTSPWICIHGSGGIGQLPNLPSLPTALPWQLVWFGQGIERKKYHMHYAVIHDIQLLHHTNAFGIKFRLIAPNA